MSPDPNMTPRTALWCPNSINPKPARPMKPLASCVSVSVVCRWLFRRRRRGARLLSRMPAHGTYTRLGPKPTHHALITRHHRLIPLPDRPPSPTAQEASKCGRRRRAPTPSPRRRRRRARMLRRRLERPRRLPGPLLLQAETHRSRSRCSSPCRCRTSRSAAYPGIWMC